MNSKGRTGRAGIIVVAIFAIISGLHELVVGLTGYTFGILSADLRPNAATAVVGAFYLLGGLSLLTIKKWGAVLGILLIAAEILGRVYLVSAEITQSQGGDAYKIAIGGAVALVVILYIVWQWKKFD